jgi:hypothetical protein
MTLRERVSRERLGECSESAAASGHPPPSIVGADSPPDRGYAPSRNATDEVIAFNPEQLQIEITAGQLHIHSVGL